MAQEVLLYFSLIICISAAIAIIARIIKQPPIIAYLIAGVLVGPIFFNLIGVSSPSEGVIQTFARIGIALLLFMVGLSLDFRLFKEIGKTSLIVGVIEVAAVSFLGFLVSFYMGFSYVTSVIVGLALSFSSTVVVVKLLSDKKEINTLHGRLALGILIIQDIIASIALMAAPFIGGGINNLNDIIIKVVMAIALIAFVFVIAKYALSKFMAYLARSQETLFLFGIAWALLLATAFYKIGFSMEIGALIAGMSLAASRYSLELEGKIKPLRDFFVIIFFVFFGSQLTKISGTIIFQALIFSLFVLLIKPLIVMISLKFFNYTKRTNFNTSLSLAQVSEFSLILILVGYSLGYINQEVMSLAVLVALITIAISTYLMNFSNSISDKLRVFLNLFEGKIESTEDKKNKRYDIILFGYHRIGYKIFDSLKRISKNILVIDYNPKVVGSLLVKGIDCIYGDAANPDFLSEIGLKEAKLIISTIPEEISNMSIKEAMKKMNSQAVFIATTEDPKYAADLYNEGIDYVIIPHHLGGENMANIIDKFKMQKEEYIKLGRDHRKKLEKDKNNSNFKDIL